jgi:hypothetical protein
LGFRLLVLGFGLLLPVCSAAQTDAPPGPYTIDVRGALGSLPQDASFFPAAPTGTPIPTGGAGFDIGGHLYLLRLGPARLGLGMNLLQVGAEASPRTPSASGSGSPQRPTMPQVTTRVRLFTPQLSFNFGSSRGWSYLSAGVGQITVSTTTSEFATSSSTEPTVPARTRDTGALQTVNFGGGARWFNTQHLAFSFDVRFHKARGRTKDDVSTVPVTLVTASAGISLK